MKRSVMAVAGKALLTALTALALASFGFYAKALLLKYPPVWPDEALFADAALSLIHRGILGTEVLSGTMPRIGERTYWMPPLYYFYLGGVFYIWGAGVVSMRLSSLAAALAVMALTCGVGLRSGLGRWLSLIPVCFLAVDTVFLRAALIGRMEMLTLAFILGALWLAMGSSDPEGYPGMKRSFFTGVASALATLTHPLGAVAPVAVMGVRTLIPAGSRSKTLSPIPAGMLLPVAPWAIYILQDWRDFLAQFGGQVVRKATYHPAHPHAAWRVGHVVRLLVANLAQYGANLRTPDEVMVPLVLAAGFAGLCWAACRQKALLVLPVCQALTLIAVVLGREAWYPACLAPLTGVGIAHLIRRAERRVPWKMACASLAILLSAWFAQRSLSRISQINYLRNTVYRSGTDYFEWCDAISKVIPSKSRVLLAVIPDPYFGLLSRSDLERREFLPARIPIDPQQYRRYLGDADYIISGPDQEHENVVGSASPSEPVNDFVRSRAKLVAVVGASPDEGYFARVYKVTK